MKRIFAAATATALLFVAPLPASSKPASEETGIEIEITELTPVHSPGEALPLTIEVTNPGPAIAEASLHITAQASVPSFRNTMTSWLADTNVETTMMTLEAQTVEVPSGTTEIEFEIPAEIFTWGNTLATWGPRGIEASLEFEGARTVDRSILVTEPSYEQEAMPFTALVPITVGGDDLAAVPTTAERYEDSLLALESGELGDNEELPDPVIEAVQGSTDRVISDIEALTSPGITLALDSSLAALEYGTLDLTEEALTDFADADHHELVLLPALDTDVAAWAQTGYDQYFATHADQMQRSTEALNQRDIAARTDLLFTPVSPSLATAALGLENGADTVVIDSSAIPSSEDLYWTRPPILVLNSAKNPMFFSLTTNYRHCCSMLKCRMSISGRRCLPSPPFTIASAPTTPVLSFLPFLGPTGGMLTLRTSTSSLACSMRRHGLTGPPHRISRKPPLFTWLAAS